MKRYIGMLAVIFIVSCSRDQKLAEENKELVKLTGELRETASLQKQLAEEAREMALVAQKAAESSAAEAQTQAEYARLAKLEVERQLSTRLTEVAELKKQLEKCK